MHGAVLAPFCLQSCKQPKPRLFDAVLSFLPGRKRLAGKQGTPRDRGSLGFWIYLLSRTYHNMNRTVDIGR